MNIQWSAYPNTFPKKIVYTSYSTPSWFVIVTINQSLRLECKKYVDAYFISENTGKFLLRNLAAPTNSIYCNSQHGALMNRCSVMMTPIGWREFPTIFWSVQLETKATWYLKNWWTAKCEAKKKAFLPVKPSQIPKLICSFRVLIRCKHFKYLNVWQNEKRYTKRNHKLICHDTKNNLFTNKQIILLNKIITVLDL